MAPWLKVLSEKLKLTADLAYLTGLSELEIQAELADKLRAAAIEYLATSDSVVARSFRGEYLASGLGDYKVFLDKQARESAWGTYIEATALGALLDWNVTVTPVKNGKQQEPLCLYRTASDAAPSVNLYNSDNTHWYVNNNTLGNGKCLYNAWAQSIQKTVQKTIPSKQLYSKQLNLRQGINRSEQRSFQAVNEHASASVKSISVAKSNIFTVVSPINKEDVIERQKAIETAIKKQFKPSELRLQLEAEQDRISKLSKAEQEQIKNDYKFALQLAITEMAYAKCHFCSVTARTFADNSTFNTPAIEPF